MTAANSSETSPQRPPRNIDVEIRDKGLTKLGSQLVLHLSAVRPAKVSDRAHLVLLRMAATALDKDRPGRPARLYFGGWIPLALILGYEAPLPGENLSPAAHKAVQRAVTELLRLGLVSHADEDLQGDHRTKVYVLHVGLGA